VSLNQVNSPLIRSGKNTHQDIRTAKMTRMPRKLTPSDPAWTDTVAEAQDALGNSVRMAIIRAMTSRDTSITRPELSAELKFSQATVSQAVEVLEQVGLLKMGSAIAANGRAVVVYEIDKARLRELTDALIGYVTSS
jgi:predicted transcriptional regulator